MPKKAPAKKKPSLMKKLVGKLSQKEPVKKAAPKEKVSRKKAEDILEAPTNAGEQVLVTEEGLAKLKEELRYLKEVRRKEVAERIKEAISYGDLSENSEYEDAKNEQAFIEGRISDLEAMIKNSKIIAGVKASGEEVQIGSTVHIKNGATRELEMYTIVGSTETDPLEGKISNESPVGSTLLGKRVGESISIKVPEGSVSYTVVKIL